MSILSTILAHKKEELLRRKRQRSEAELLNMARNRARRGFLAALERAEAARPAAVIAEVKKASPSKGVIRPDFHPETIAAEYAKAGAAALSVLTDEHFFQGSDKALQQARAACDLPVLRKDFLIDPYQVLEASAIGADAILIIMAAVDDACASELMAAAEEFGLDALVEVHDEREMERALKLGARLVGINNRNLRTFKVSLATTERLAPIAQQAGTWVVAESGIHGPEDMQRLISKAQVKSFLIGEVLMRAPSPGARLKDWLDALSRMQ